MSLPWILTISVSLGTFIAVKVSRHQEDDLLSLKDTNTNLKKWACLSILHIVIVGAYAWFLEYMGILRIQNEVYESYPLGVCIVLSYWFVFECWYTLTHFLQHKIKWLGYLTGHWIHHELKEPHGPDYLSAFVAHPIDAINVQVAVQCPWLIAYLAGVDMVLSDFLYGSIVTLLVYLGIRAHCACAFGGFYHVQHHNNPAKGYYSFSGIPEVIYHCVW